MTDEQLMERVKHGERTALAELFRRHERPLFNFFRRGFGHPEDAEDLAMETLLRVFRNADRFRSGGSFRAWLYCIAVSVARDWSRRRGRRPEVSASSVAEEWAGAEDDRPEGRPEEMAVRGDLAGAVRDALRTLPEKERAALLLREYQQLSYEEIGAALGASLGSVKMLLLRGRRRLRRHLEADYLAEGRELCL
jgi:RNA polymerase sigma-70 factor (ECF subfamily)